MWKPKSQEFEDLANVIARDYVGGMLVPEIAEKYKLSIPSIYRYLHYKRVPIRPKGRDDRGRFTAYKMPA